MHQISQKFETSIVRIEADGTELPVFPNLAAAVVAWEREIPDDEDVDLHVASDDEEDDEDEESEIETEDHEDEDDGFLVADEHDVLPDGEVRVVARVNTAMLAELKDMQSSRGEYKIRFTYSGILVREFDVTEESYLVLNSGTQPADNTVPLEAEIFFDVFGQDTRY